MASEFRGTTFPVGQDACGDSFSMSALNVPVSDGAVSLASLWRPNVQALPDGAVVDQSQVDSLLDDVQRMIFYIVLGSRDLMGPYIMLTGSRRGADDD